MYPSRYVYIKLEVGGIQKYICSTGKLKEMLGGSEIIDCLSDHFLSDRLNELKLYKVEKPKQDRDWYIEIQKSAGTICLIMPDGGRAAEFLTRFSEAALESFPGLPLYGVQVPMEWTVDSYRQARRKAENHIAEQRALCPVSIGNRMLPILESARLDGFPACAKDKDELVSVPSVTRRTKECLKASKERLRNLTEAPNGVVDVQWEDDLSKMLGEERARVALIHIDGNDLGKLFRKKLEDSKGLPLEESIATMRALSNTIVSANEAAFKAAVKAVVDFEHASKGGRPCLVMPLRPLVMGGDDITLVIRADLALLFLTRFAAEFEKKSEECGERLSVGAGMVVMKASYPFAKAFSLVEMLTESAKRATFNVSPRPSSVDYLVLTEDVEDDLEAYRRRVCTASDGCLLTTKPFILSTVPGNAFEVFLRSGGAVLKNLPRSAVRAAMNACHSGKTSSQQHWTTILKNLKRGIGGRFGSGLMQAHDFEKLFEGGFFTKEDKTILADCLELDHLLPALEEARRVMLSALCKEENAE